jgi:hypothetical protein
MAGGTLLTIGELAPLTGLTVKTVHRPDLHNPHF